MSNRAAGFHLAKRLRTLARRHAVPGAAAGIHYRGEVSEGACGLASVNTGLAVTADTLFQIGSITKVYTATLAMGLADAGELTLDTAIRRYLPDIEFADTTASNEITLRHLLTHTSGLEGDVFIDCGRGDDAVARYVRALQDLPLLYRPGERLSYCNSGFVLVGHLIERLTGRPYHQALVERLLRPMGLKQTLLLPEEIMLRRFAVGHLADGDGAPCVAPLWSLPPALAPAGSLTCATVADVLRFARLHMEAGRGQGRQLLLSTSSARAMQSPEVSTADRYTLGESRGLGWFVERWGAHSVLAHDGGTIGQSSFLRMLPEEDLIVVLLTNGGDAQALYREIVGEIFRAYAGISLPPAPQPTVEAERQPLQPYTGRYRRAHMSLEFRVRSGVLTMDATPDGPLAEWTTPQRGCPLLAIGPGEFLPAEGVEPRLAVVFAATEGTTADWVYIGGRAHRRCAE